MDRQQSMSRFGRFIPLFLALFFVSGLSLVTTGCPPLSPTMKKPPSKPPQTAEQKKTLSQKAALAQKPKSASKVSCAKVESVPNPNAPPMHNAPLATRKSASTIAAKPQGTTAKTTPNVLPAKTAKPKPTARNTAR